MLVDILFNESTDAMVLLNQHSEIVQKNQAFEKLLSTKNSLDILVTQIKQIMVKKQRNDSKKFVQQINIDSKLFNMCFYPYDDVYSNKMWLVKFELLNTECINVLNQHINRQSQAILDIAKNSEWQTSELEDSFKYILQKGAHVLDLDFISIWTIENEDLVCMLSFDVENGTYSKGQVISRSEFPKYMDYLNEQWILDVDDTFTDERTIEFREQYFIPKNIKSTMDCHIKSGGKIIGILCSERTKFRGKWRVDEKNFAGYLSETISHIISAHQAIEAKKNSWQNESYFKSLIENSQDIIATSDENWKITYQSPSSQRLMGYSEEDVNGTNPIEYIHPDDVESLINKMQVVNSNLGLTVKNCYRYKHKDGRWRYLESLTTNLLHLPEVKSIVMNIRDVTEQKETQNEISKKEKYFRLLIENSFDVKYTADWEGNITYISPSVFAILGFTPEEITGKNGWHFIEDSHKESISKDWKEFCKQPMAVMNKNFPLIRKDKALVDVELIAINLFHDPDIQGAVITFRDVTERKTYEQKLQQSEEFYRALIENSNDAMTIVDENGVRKYVSGSSEKLFGRAKEELLGKPVFDIAHTDYLEDIKIRFQNFKTQYGAIEKSQLKIYNPKLEEWIDVEIFAKNLLHNKVVNGIVIITSDITQRVKAIEELNKSREYFRALIENSSDVISVIDANGKRTFASLSNVQVFGRKPEDLIGKSSLDFVHPDDLPNILQKLQELLNNPGVPIVTNARFSHANGEWMYVNAIGCNLLHNPAVQGIVLNARDNTATMLAQQKLVLSEQYYRSLIENSNDMLAICNENYFFKYSSPSIERFLGYSILEYTNESFLSYVHTDYLEQCKKVFQKSLEHPGVTFKQEIYHRHKNGHYIYLETIFNNLLHDEAVKGIVMISRDISDRKNAEIFLQNYNQQLASEVNAKTVELKQQNIQLSEVLTNLQSAQAQLVQSEKMASLGLLTAGIAHEINNPINFITANIKPLKRDIALLKNYLNQIEVLFGNNSSAQLNSLKQEMDIDYSTEEIEQLLNGIEDGATRTFEIIRGLKEFSRLDEDDLKKADINQCIITTLTLLQSSISNQIEIEKNFSKLPLIECYPGKLNQVFMNIISNAHQSINGSGKITINTRTDADRSNIIISIKDTGKGMSAEVKNRIFEPFYTTKEVGEGTGLGLFISFGIIENHQGKIEVNSEPSNGTEFIIKLPIERK